MRYFPINVDIRGRKCVVIGGGNVALRKVESLLKAGAGVRLVSPQVKEEVGKLADCGTIAWTARIYEYGDLEGAALAFVAVDDPNVGEEVAKEAEDRNILINVADIPEQCAFTLPSCLERGDILFTISTGGKCPALAKHMRIKLDKLIEEDYGPFLDVLAGARERMIKAGIGHDKCRQLLNKLIASDILPLIKDDKMAEARSIADTVVAEAVEKR